MNLTLWLKRSLLRFLIWIDKCVYGFVPEYPAPRFSGNAKDRRMKTRLYLRGVKDGYRAAAIDFTVGSDRTQGPVSPEPIA